MSGNRLACPYCLNGDFLFENASGWREVGAVRMVAGRIVGTRHPTRVQDAERVSWGCSNEGCNVDHELRDDELVQLGVDGKPIPNPPKEQERLDV